MVTPADEHGRFRWRSSAAASWQNELPAGVDLAVSAVEIAKAPALSARETDEDYSSSDNDGSTTLPRTAAALWRR